MALTANVHITTALRDGRTVLRRSFCGAPFKVADVTEDRRSETLKLMLMSSSPGLLDGDDFRFQIDVGAGCSVSLETQSYQRLFQGKNGASQRTVVNMERGSSFHYLPHPTVPHRGSRYTAQNKIRLRENCTLLWGEVVSCGRKSNDEVFAFTSFHSLTEVYREEKLVVKENLFLAPATMRLNEPGQMEGYTHSATLLYLNEWATIETLSEELWDKFSLSEDIAFGVSALPVNGLTVRILGHKAEALFALLKRMACFIEMAKAKVETKQEYRV